MKHFYEFYKNKVNKTIIIFGLNVDHINGIKYM